MRVDIKGRQYMVQANGSCRLDEGVKSICRQVYRRYVLDRLIISDEENRQINGAAQVKWFTRKPIFLSVHRATRLTVDSSLSLSAQRFTTGGHVYFYITYAQGTQYLFLNKWYKKNRFLRIEAVTGETLKTATVRDGRVKYLLNDKIYNFVSFKDKVVYLERHVINLSMCRKSFYLSFK